ncbi:MAG: DUF4215 domain-containing protein [Polyangiaceae bacterium]|nr:DUF4215 domain-containing protein [Polyangiaceae bacterium]
MRRIWMPALIAGLFIVACGDDTGTGGSAGSETGGGGSGGDGGTPSTGGNPSTGGEGGMPSTGGQGGDGGGGGGAECGNGALEADEACDDGNSADNDGCSASCAVETGYDCTGEPSECAPICGDGVVLRSEGCDDGNADADDGCDASCVVETGYNCAGEPSICMTDCGDGILAGAEACDDGNDVANDGCDMQCAEESGYSCAGEPSVCTATCGDGLIALGAEECDDQNTNAADGCAADCNVEIGYSCAGEPSTCMTSCGDGVVAGTESCDDGNLADGDGCSAACAEENGYDCSGSPSVCATTCGDGVMAGTEACDDANIAAGDCCSSTCAVEPGCETEPNNTDATADVFDTHQVGGVVYGFVNPAGDSNHYSVTLTVPGSIVAETIDGILGTTCTGNNIDSRIRIFDSTGVQLVSNDDKPANWCSLATTGLLQPGTYYVVVDASTFNASDTFDYGLTVTIDNAVCADGDLDPGETCDDGNVVAGDGCGPNCQIECNNEVEPNDASGTATALNVPGNVNCGAVNPGTDLDFWSFTTTSVTDVRLETFDPTGTACGSSIDTVIELRGTNGTTVLASDDEDGISSCSMINATNDAGARQLPPGTYYVRVIDFGSNTVIPGYRVGVTFTAVCGNGAVEGFEECDGGATCNTDCTRIPVCGDTFIDAPETCDDGNVVPGDGCSATCQGEGVTNEVEPNGTTAEADVNPVQITGDIVIGGAIPVVGDQDTFRMTVATDSVVRIETFGASGSDCSGMDTNMFITDSTGTAVSSDSSIDDGGISTCSAFVRFLPAGTYYIRVIEYNNDATIAAYRLAVKFQGDTGSETEPNDTLAQASANLGGGTDVFVFGGHQVDTDDDWYAVTVPAGSSIRAEVIEGSAAETCESNGINARLTLYSAAMTQLVDDDNDGRGNCPKIDGSGASPLDSGAHNLAAGTYYVQVRRSGSITGVNAQLDYRLQVTVRTP